MSEISLIADKYGTILYTYSNWYKSSYCEQGRTARIMKGFGFKRIGTVRGLDIRVEGIDSTQKWLKMAKEPL